MAYSFDLNFIKPKVGDIPGPPIARIYVKHYSMDEDGLMSITPDCISIVELEYHINRLQVEISS